MKKTGTIIVAAMLAAPWLGPLAAWGTEDRNFSYRFLWPAGAGKPGQDLVELLPAAEASVKEIETPLGLVKTKALTLSLPSGSAALDALAAIAEAPLRWPGYMHGSRRFLLLRFPFSVVYRQRR